MGKNTATIIQRLEGNGKIFLPLRGENPVNFPGFPEKLGQKRPAAGRGKDQGIGRRSFSRKVSPDCWNWIWPP